MIKQDLVDAGMVKATKVKHGIKLLAKVRTTHTRDGTIEMTVRQPKPRAITPTPTTTTNHQT